MAAISGRLLLFFNFVVVIPGENCAIYGCSASRRQNVFSRFHYLIAILPENVAVNLLILLLKIDASLKAPIESRKLFLYEQHFTSDQYYQYESRKSLEEGGLPKSSLPAKSISKPSVGRSISSIQKRDRFLVSQELSPPPLPSSCIYIRFSDFTQRIAIGDSWEVKTHNNFFSLRIFFLENYYKDWLDNKFCQSQSTQKYLQQPLK